MTAHPLFRLVLPGPVLCLAVPADGSLVAAGDREGNLTVAGPDGALRWQKQLGEGIHGLTVSRDGSRLVVGSKDCRLRMFSGDGELEWEQLLGKSVWSLAMDPSGNYLVAGTGDSVALFTDGGIMVWEHETSRAMVGVGIAHSATKVVACGDELLFCLGKEGELQWQQRRDDSLWDATISADGERVLLGGWDRSVHCLDGSGADRWNHLTGGYVRSVAVLDDGGALAGSHDGQLYRLSAEGELQDSRRPGGEITAIGAAEGLALVAVGTGSEVVAYALDTPMTAALPQQATESNAEPMFGFGMFGTPAPDTSGLEPATSMSGGATSTPRAGEGGEFREFAHEVVQGDVRNYLRLGNVAWKEGRLARALEHYQRATEVEPAEPRAWHNLAVCRYYLALKSNPDDVDGAVTQAFEPLRTANRSDTQYEPALNTLEYFAQLLELDLD